MSTPPTAIPLDRASPHPRALRTLRAAAIGSLAGILSGVIWGLLARGAMRAIAQAMHQLPSFSVEGTLMILLIGAMLGSLIGATYGLLRGALPARRLVRGITLIALMQATLGLWIATGPLMQEGLPTIVPLAMALFAGSIVIWGALIEAVLPPLDARILVGRGWMRTLAASLALCAPGLALLTMIVAQQLGFAAA